MTFTSGSWWNTPVPATVTRDRDSDTFIRWLWQSNARTYLTVSTDAWSMPVYRATAADPVRTITPTKTGPTVSCHVPSGMVPMLGDDAAAVILDPITDQAVGLFEFDPIRPSATGIDRYYMSSEGVDERAGGTKGNRGHRGIPAPQACIRSEHLADPSVRTRLKIAIPGTAAAHYYPLVGDEGDKGGIVGEGMVMRIKPGVDVARRVAGPAYRVARGIQRYGVVVGDNGAQATLKQERGLGLPADALASFPWGDWEFVERGWKP